MSSNDRESDIFSDDSVNFIFQTGYDRRLEHPDTLEKFKYEIEGLVDLCFYRMKVDELTYYVKLGAESGQQGYMWLSNNDYYSI